MTDLFQSTEDTTEARRHECEVNDCVKRIYPDGQKMADHLALIEKKRGHGPAEKLRADCRVAWAKHRDEIASQG